MIVQTRENKDLVIPKSLGNFVTEGSGGITPEEAAEIASAVTEEAISEYDTELQVDLEEIREAVSGNTDTLLDLATIAAMGVAERVALFDEIYEKASNGEKIYIRGLVQEETIRTAILPLVSYRPETNPVLHQGGNLYFAAKGDTDNIYFHIALSSEGAIDPTSSTLIKRNIYTLPTASSEVKGGVRIGSGLLMTQDTLSVDTTGLVTDGDLAPFIVQLSGNTEDISTLSATTGEISQQIGSLSGLTDDIATISGQTSANTQDIGILSGVSSALTASVSALTANDNIAFFNLIKDYGNSNEELARLYDDMDAANTAGKTVVALSNFATGDTTIAAVFVTFRKDMNGGFYGAGSGVHYNGTAYIAARAVPVFRRDDYYNVIKKDGHFYFSDMGTIAPYTLPTASSSTKGGIKVGSGLTMGGDYMSIKAGEGLGFSGDTLVVSGATGGGGKTPIVIEEHYDDPTWTAIYNAVAQSAATMGVEEFAKNYDIYIKKLDDGDNPYALRQAVGFGIQQGEDWDKTAEEWVQTTWVTFNTFEGVGNNYWLLSTGSRGLGVIGGFDGNVPHPKSAWINIDASGNVTDFNISYVDEGLAQYPDNGADYAFSMYLCCLLSDAERYRGNLQNYRKNYNGVNGNHFFRFIIDIEGTEYEAEYYWDQENQQLVKIVFQTYKAYLQSILNS